MKKTKEAQGGFMLVMVMIGAIVLLILAVAITRYGQSDAEIVVRSKVDSNLQVALDNGLDRAINALNTGSNWNSPTTLNGFSSLIQSAYAFNDLSATGVIYYVKILDGAKAVTFSSKLLNDTAAATLTNTGDIYYDRTILVRAWSVKNNISATASAIVHRNDLVPPNPIGGITTMGNLDAGNSNMHSYNSCSGVAPGGCSGTVMSGGTLTTDPNGCLQNVQNPNLIPYPTIACPASGTVPFPGHALTDDVSPSANQVLTAGNYQCHNFSMGGNSNFYLDTCGGKVNIFVCGTMTCTGNPAIQSGCVPQSGASHPTGGSPVNATFYVAGATVDLAGTGTYEFLLLAPSAVVNINGGGNGSFFGAVVAKTYNGGSSSAAFFNFDACLLQKAAADSYLRPPVITSSWKPVP